MIFSSFNITSWFVNKGEYAIKSNIEIEKKSIIEDYSKISNGFFTENKGQWNSELLFIAETSFGHIGLGNRCVYYNLREVKKSLVEDNLFKKDLNSINNDLEKMNIKCCILKLTFENARYIEPVGLEPLQHNNNYFYDNDSSKWITSVRNYRKVQYSNLWEGIDLIYYFNGKELKYEFIVHPNTPPEKISIKVDGHNSLKLINNGLEINTSLGIPIKDSNLKVFYINDPDIQLTGSFNILDTDTFSFKIPEFNSQREIVIDPIVYSTYFRSYNYDRCNDIKIDNDGNVYVVGGTYSTDFPTTPGVYNKYHNGNWDIFVFKLNSKATELIYSTFVGTDYGDIGDKLAIDSNGNSFITCHTGAMYFPTTQNAYARTGSEGINNVVFKLNSDGSNLLFSTYVSGTDEDYSRDICIDTNGNVFVSGKTLSTDFPVTENAYNSPRKGGFDIFVFKLNATGSELLFSAIIGGTNEDIVNGMRIDSKGNTYLAGQTTSKLFPTTNNCYDSSYNGEGDAFVLKLNPSGSDLIFSTYIGGTEYDSAYGITIDKIGNSFITGETLSNNFPSTPDAFDDNFNGWNDVFITKISQIGSEIIYSTFIGGSRYDHGIKIEIDDEENLYVTGSTDSPDFPQIENPNINSEYSYPEDEDLFIIILNQSGSALLHINIIGGDMKEEVDDLAINLNGNVFVMGRTYSSNFPITNDSFDTSFDEGENNFLLKYSFPSNLKPLTMPDPPQNIQAKIGKGFINLSWDPPTNNGGSEIAYYRVYKFNEYEKNLINSITYFNDTTVINGNNYSYFITSLSSIGESKPSYELNATPVGISNQPLYFSASGKEDYVSLSWVKPWDDGGMEILIYKLYRENLTGDEQDIISINGTVCEYNDTNVTIGIKYFYFITALNNIGESPPSRTVNATPLFDKNPPGEFNATIGDIYVNLSWNPPDHKWKKQIEKYKLYKSINGNMTFFKSVPANVTFYQDTSVRKGETYYYQITAEILSIESYSANLKVIMDNLPTPPKNLTVWLNDNKILLSWDYPIYDGGLKVKLYKVYKGTSPGEEKFFVDIESHTLYYEDKNIQDGKKYFYYVTAINDEGESRPSNIENITVSLTSDQGTSLFYLFFPIIIFGIVLSIIIKVIIYNKRKKSKSNKISKK